MLPKKSVESDFKVEKKLCSKRSLRIAHICQTFVNPIHESNSRKRYGITTGSTASWEVLVAFEQKVSWIWSDTMWRLRLGKWRLQLGKWRLRLGKWRLRLGDIFSIHRPPNILSLLGVITHSLGVSNPSFFMVLWSKGNHKPPKNSITLQVDLCSISAPLLAPEWTHGTTAMQR